MATTMRRTREAVPSDGRRATGNRGFTMLELMVALTIAGMMLLAGLPSFTTFLRNAEIRSTAESIGNGLRIARSEATRLNRPVSFTLAGAGDPGWTINIFDPVTGALLQPPLDRYSKLEVGHSATVATTPANALAVTFNGLGRIVSPSPIATPNLQQIDVKSIVVDEARALRIYADDLHGIRMCDPDPALKALIPPDARAC
jgi:type IV fimbrial biogenesis protein FimT